MGNTGRGNTQLIIITPNDLETLGVYKEHSMRDISDLNINEGGKHVRRKPPTLKDIAAIEEKIGFIFPMEYKQLIQYSNGGHPQKNTFIPFSSEFGTRWSIDIFYHWGPDKKCSENILNVIEVWQKYLGKEAIPFARDPGGNQICFNALQGGTIFISIHDENFRRIEVSKSFNSLLNLLEEDPDMI